MADMEFETPGNDPEGDPEDVEVRRSGRKIKPATFADGTAVNTFIKSECGYLVTLRIRVPRETLATLRTQVTWGSIGTCMTMRGLALA